MSTKNTYRIIQRMETWATTEVQAEVVAADEDNDLGVCDLYSVEHVLTHRVIR